MHRRLVLAAAALLVAGCGGPSGAAPATAGPHNDTDVMFAQMTLDHHRQAADVVQILGERAQRPQVRALAATMRDEWSGEAVRLRAWLEGWRSALTPNPDAGLHAGHGDLHSLRPSDVEELRGATGADVDRIGLNLLLGHHHNTVEVARLEVAGGGNPDAKALAEQIAQTRQEQVRTMLGLVAG